VDRARQRGRCDDTYCAIIKTTRRIVAGLFPQVAPKNTNSFVSGTARLYDGVTCIRVISNFMRRTGDQPAQQRRPRLQQLPLESAPR